MFTGLSLRNSSNKITKKINRHPACERFFAVYWPLKHLTTSTRAYTIIIVVIWTLAATATAVYILTGNLISNKAGYYVSTILFSIFIFILCGCNILVFGESFTRETTLFYNKKATESHKTNA